MKNDSTTRRAIAEAVQWALDGCPTPAGPQADEIHVEADASDPSIIRFTMPVTVEALSRIVAGLYEDGMTHAQVTSWLEERVPRFREAMSEIHFEGGARWMQTPPRIFMRLEIGEPVVVEEAGPAEGDAP